MRSQAISYNNQVYMLEISQIREFSSYNTLKLDQIVSQGRREVTPYYYENFTPNSPAPSPTFKLESVSNLRVSPYGIELLSVLLLVLVSTII